MAIVKQVTHGQVILEDTQLSVDVTLNTAITLAKSFLVFGVEQNDDTPEEEWVRGQIINTTTLRFTRTAVSSSNSDITISYHLIEFESGVAVQHGVLEDPSTGANDISLASTIDLSRAFVLLSASNTGTGLSDDEFYSAALPATDTLRISVLDGKIGNFIAWQVIEFADSVVQSGSVSFGTGDTVKPVTLASAVDASKTWLSFSYTSDNGTSTNLGQKMVRGEISTNGTTVTFTRENSGQAIVLSYFVIEFTDDTTVQRGIETIATSELDAQVSLTAVNPDHALPILAGLYDRMGSTSFNSDETPGVATARLELVGAGATLSLSRGLDDAAASFVWQVIEFPTQASSSGGGSGTLGALAQDWVDDNEDLRIRFTEEGQIQVGDFDAGVLSTADSLIEAHRAEGSSLPQRGLHTLGKIAGAVSNAISWVVGELELLGTATISSIHTAVRGRLTHSSTGDSSNAELRAGDFETINQSGTSGTPVGTAVGVQGTVDNQEDAYLTKASGVVAQIQNATGADIETAVALEVAAPVNDGTIDTLIGLDIPDMNEGTENYALRTGEGLVSLGDVLDVPIVTISPAVPAAGKLRVYFKLDGSNQPELYVRASSGTEYKVTLS